MRIRAGTAARRQRDRRAVDSRRGRRVLAVELEHIGRLDVEIEHQEQQRFEAIDELGVAGRLELAAAQAIEIAVQRGEVA